ncbi:MULTISPECIES: ECF-type sigma factor [Lysobacter]|uniref:ECF-type sigma factor n=1 Tax=Lysobacter firmicutimachus TaxID=1792846 RepID=A0ABU8CZ62_9GAMM|nr:ECF-type sigma factor [Lysobacter antibioticus]
MDGVEGRVDEDLTVLLHGWRAGDAAARDRLFVQVYDTLRGMAAARLRARGGERTLQATSLVNEALMRLLGGAVDWQDRAHFFALAALKMRSVLVDEARARAADKRGAHPVMLTLSHADLGGGATAGLDVLALHEALQRLSERDPRAARAVEMAYFGGMAQNEIACVLEVSLPTVERDLRFARAWLSQQLS